MVPLKAIQLVVFFPDVCIYNVLDDAFDPEWPN